MAFDQIRGAGNIPRAQPAQVILNEEFVYGPSQGAEDQTRTVTIGDNIQTSYMTAQVSFVRNSGPANQTNPLVVLRQNEREIQRTQWQAEFTDIEVNQLTGDLFRYQDQRTILLLRNGDTLSLQLTFGAGHTSNSQFTFTFNIYVLGTYL